MHYALHQMRRAMLEPARAMAALAQSMGSHTFSPLAYTPMGRAMAAGAELFEDFTRPRGRPAWDITPVAGDGAQHPVSHSVLSGTPFARLLRFGHAVLPKNAPRVLLVPPLSGHYPTLLRGTVSGLVAQHDLHVIDWHDARDVPLAAGAFGTDTYIDTLIAAMRALGPDLHVVAVCQPAPLVLAAVAALAMADDLAQPRSMVLMGGPVDVRAAPTQPTRLAAERKLDWFERNCIATVPPAHPGAGRLVYPGFMQLTAFMAMNPERHLRAHLDQFNHLVQGDGDSSRAHKKFYDEYLAVMDVPGEYYLETIDRVFQRALLPRGQFPYRGITIDLRAIARTGLMTVEGGQDDISAPGQTFAAHMLCGAIPIDARAHLLEHEAGHYGIFNGRRWRESILPAVARFVRR